MPLLLSVPFKWNTHCNPGNSLTHSILLFYCTSYLLNSFRFVLILLCSTPSYPIQFYSFPHFVSIVTPTYRTIYLSQDIY